MGGVHPFPYPAKNRPRIKLKSIHISVETDHKSIKHRPKMNQQISWMLLAANPENEDGAQCFGALLGPSWRPLGPSWRPLGPVLAVLAASWARLGLVLAAEIGPQVDQISTQKTIRTLMPLGIDFLEDFGGFGEVKWKQVGSKIGAKIDLNSKGRKSSKR